MNNNTRPGLLNSQDNMMHEDDKTDRHEHLPGAYNRMMARVKTAIEETEKEAIPALTHLIELAKEKAIDLGELSREEAEKISAYLARDVEDAANYLAGPEPQALADWLKFDISLIEERILELFSSVADKTKLELMALEQRAHQAPEYHSGEITGIGSLVCLQCGQQTIFHTTGRISPCTSCGHETFARPLMQ